MVQIVCEGGAFSVTVIVIENGIRNPSSSPGRSSLHFTLC